MQDMNDILDIEGQDTAMRKATKGFSKLVAVLVILIVAGFGDVMYLVLMSGKFPSGPLLIMCYLGAFTSFAAMGYLLMGKTIAFAPGKQMLAAWIVFAVELAMIALNLMLVFEQGSKLSDFMLAWSMIAPATPVINMIGVALIFFLDEDMAEEHRDREMVSDVKQSNRKYKKMLHKTRIAVQTKQLQYTSTALMQAVESQPSQVFIQQFGQALNAKLLGDLTGMHFDSHSQLGAPAPMVGLPQPTAVPQPQPTVIESDNSPKKGILGSIKAAFVGEAPAQPTTLQQTATVSQPASHAPKFMTSTASATPQTMVARRRQARRSSRIIRNATAAAAPAPTSTTAGNGATQSKNVPSSAKRVKRGASTQTKP